jgi:hypothetical protein
MFRYALLLSTVVALPVAAQPYNGGSLVTAGDSNSGLLHTISPTAGNVAGPVVRDAGVAVNQQVGNTLLGSGSDIAPIDHLTTSLGTVVNKIAGKVTDAGSAINAQGLAGTPIVGTAVGQIATRTDATVNPLLSVTVADRQVSGSPSGAQLLNASVLSSGLASGAPISASVLSGGQVLSLNGTSVPGDIGSGGAGGLLGGLLGPVTGGGTGGLLGGVTTTVSNLTGGLAGGGSGGTGGLLGGVLGPVTGGGSGGLLGGVTGAVSGLTGGLGVGSAGSGGVGGLVGGLTGTVTNLAGGLTGGQAGGAGGLLGGVTSTVSNLTGGLAGGSGGLLGGVLGGGK